MLNPPRPDDPVDSEIRQKTTPSVPGRSKSLLEPGRSPASPGHTSERLIRETHPRDSSESLIRVTHPSHSSESLMRVTHPSHSCESLIRVTHASHLSESLIRVTQAHTHLSLSSEPLIRVLSESLCERGIKEPSFALLDTGIRRETELRETEFREMEFREMEFRDPFLECGLERLWRLRSACIARDTHGGPAGRHSSEPLIRVTPPGHSSESLIRVPHPSHFSESLMRVTHPSLSVSPAGLVADRILRGDGHGEAIWHSSESHTSESHSSKSLIRVSVCVHSPGRRPSRGTKPGSARPGPVGLAACGSTPRVPHPSH